MEIITYSLRNGQKRSDQFYRDVATFTDEVLAEAEGRIGPLVASFQSYLQQTGIEAPRTAAEYSFELLTLGVLWRVYAAEALKLHPLAQRNLTALFWLRQRRNFLKPVVDALRGVLATLFLLPAQERAANLPAPTLTHLDQLLNWLEATGDFPQEVRRLKQWRDFLAGQTPETLTTILSNILALAAWFESRSLAELGRYTPAVEQFLTESHPRYRWREDAIFCGRQRVEYHLNMVGTQILNRAYRATFLETKQKVVLVPPCMKARPDSECEAQQTPVGARCAGCTPGCRVHQLTQLGQRHGFQVLIMPHELSVFSNGAIRPDKDAAVGVVGVSCPLTNPTGGWETKALGIPAQGVLLDYCGCRYHWHKQGIPTDLNIGQLLRVLDVDRLKRRQDGSEKKIEE